VLAVRLLRWIGRRWKTVAAYTILITLGVVGIAWLLARFPAEVESIDGTPFELQAQRGVPDTEVASIRAGLRAIDAYLESEVGITVTGPVVVRVTWLQGCRTFMSPQSAGAGWADSADFICLNPPQWRFEVDEHSYYPARLAAHEHVHNLQAQLGCYRDHDDQEWQWLFEGMAEQFAHAALVDAGIITPAEAELNIWEYGGLRSDNGTLADYERSSEHAEDSYGLFHIGAQVLAERVDSPAAFADFCRRAGAGVPWREAFVDSFGITVPELYELVEAERARLRLKYDSPT
jgi:hypothetical protein